MPSLIALAVPVRHYYSAPPVSSLIQSPTHISTPKRQNSIASELFPATRCVSAANPEPKSPTKSSASRPKPFSATRLTPASTLRLGPATRIFPFSAVKTNRASKTITPSCTPHLAPLPTASFTLTSIHKTVNADFLGVVRIEILRCARLFLVRRSLLVSRLPILATSACVATIAIPPPMAAQVVDLSAALKARQSP